MGKKGDIVCGFGINDVDEEIKNRKGLKDYYSKWHNMIQRCYDENIHKRQERYIGCSVCDEWRSLSNFKEWYDEHYVEGYALDKDLLVKGNKVYSPDTCVFLPRQINNFLSVHAMRENGLPRGVSEYNGEYMSSICKKSLGKYSTIEDARNVYIIAKEANAKILAYKYKDKIEKRAFDALMNYKEE